MGVLYTSLAMLLMALVAVEADTSSTGVSFADTSSPGVSFVPLPMTEEQIQDASTSFLDRRMGVIGPLSTPLPPIFESENVVNTDVGLATNTPSESRVSEQLLKISNPAPLSPHSPYNIISQQYDLTNAALFNAEERQFNQINVDAEDDLSLKLKALSQAQAASESSILQHLGKYSYEF